MKTNKILLSVVAGMAVGAALGVLFAPDKGSDTRKKIVKKGGDYAAGFRKWCENSLQQFESLKDSFGNNTEDTAQKGKAEDIKTS